MNVTAYPRKGAGLESLITEKKSCWERLKAEKRPIFIYGMGDGAMKILAVFRKFGIAAAGIFASDEYVRGHSFAGYRVHKLSEVEEAVDDFVVVLAFAAGYPELVDKIRQLSKRHPLYAPDVPVIGPGLFTYEYCMEHLPELNAVFRSLADAESRRVFLNTIQFKISGCIGYLDSITASADSIYKDLLRLSRNETIVDLGAYNGDTIREVLGYTGQKYYAIHAVEPDFRNFRKLLQYIDDNEMKRISAYHCAAWCKNGELPFHAKAGRQSSLSPEGKPLPAKSVDSLLKGQNVSYLKMDVEGYEREALWGASKTIVHYAPKLSVAMYHRNEDLFELPLLVKKLNPRYKLYIRHRLYIPAWETNLYAIPEN